MRTFIILTSFLLSTLAWADDNCSDSARALLAVKEFFDGTDTIMVKQETEAIESFTDIEAPNKYIIETGDGRPLGVVAEQSGGEESVAGGAFGFLKRQALKHRRSGVFVLVDQNREEVLRFERPLQGLVYKSRMKVSARGTHLGEVEQKAALTSRQYDLCSSEGRAFGKLKSPFFKKSKYSVLDESGNEVGKITKKWGGMVKERFTTADDFEVELPADYSEAQKAILLAAVFSIDMDCFEESVGDDR